MDCAVVKDCEIIRQVLLGDKEKAEDRKWTILGQSFGGFCAITYLSFFSEGLKEVFLTGGLAPLVDSPDAVYTALIGEHCRLREKLQFTPAISQRRSLRGIVSTTPNTRRIFGGCESLDLPMPVRLDAHAGPRYYPTLGDQQCDIAQRWTIDRQSLATAWTRFWPERSGFYSTPLGWHLK